MNPNDMSPAERAAYLRRWFPGLTDREFYRISIGETIDDGGFWCNADIRTSSLQSGPKAGELQSGGYRTTASAATYGRVTQEESVLAVRGAL